MKQISILLVIFLFMNCVDKKDLEENTEPQLNIEEVSIDSQNQENTETFESENDYQIVNENIVYYMSLINNKEGENFTETDFPFLTIKKGILSDNYEILTDPVMILEKESNETVTFPFSIIDIIKITPERYALVSEKLQSKRESQTFQSILIFDGVKGLIEKYYDIYGDYIILNNTIITNDIENTKKERMYITGIREYLDRLNNYEFSIYSLNNPEQLYHIDLREIDEYVTYCSSFTMELNKVQECIIINYWDQEYDFIIQGNIFQFFYNDDYRIENTEAPFPE